MNEVFYSVGGTNASQQIIAANQQYAEPPVPAYLVGHVTWQGPPAQPNARQQLPITLTLRYTDPGVGSGTAAEYTGLATDASGYFTVPVSTLPLGNYNWRVKGPRYLANSGSLLLTGDSLVTNEMGQMRAGDANNDNVVSTLDFNLLKSTFGKSPGDPGYDARADFNNDNVISTLDFNLLKGNFGIGGGLPIGPNR